MTTRLYLVRHGQTVWNAEKRMQGWLDSPLTELGRMQARLLAERLHDVDLAAIYASSSARAMATAEILRDGRQLPVIPRDALREISLGDWEGRLGAEVRAETPALIDAFWQSPHLFARASGETYAQVLARVGDAVRGIVAEHAGRDVLIVTHTVALKLILSIFEGRPLDQLWENGRLEPASLSLVEIQDRTARVVMVGDIAHYAGRLPAA